MGLLPTCLATLLVLLVASCTPPADKRNRVIIISIDTLRADRLGAYGNDRPTSPNLDRFASEDAVLFSNAYSQSNWTIPSHMSLFTGLYPDTHGVLKQDARLAPEVPTIAEVFRDAGNHPPGSVALAAFTDGGFLAGSYGFADGFDSYDDKHEEPKGVFGLRRTYQLADDWLTEHHEDIFLIFLDSYDVHAAYYFPDPYRNMFQDTVEETATGREKMQWVGSLEDCG